jgi:hypothetical protein
MARLVSTIHNVPFGEFYHLNVQILLVLTTRCWTIGFFHHTVLTMLLAIFILKSAVRLMNTNVNSIFHLALFGVATALLTMAFAPVP